jgi:hypothetical protein
MGRKYMTDATNVPSGSAVVPTATIVPVNAFALETVEPVSLKIAGVSVPGYKFISADNRRVASIPAFMMDAIDWIRENISDKTMGKEDFQKKMREIAIRDYGMPSSKSRQYYARWAEMSSIGYAQNPGWIAWLQPVQIERSRLFRVMENDESPTAAVMLTRENSPTYGKAKEKVKATRKTARELELEARLAELEALVSVVEVEEAAETIAIEEVMNETASEEVAEETEVVTKPKKANGKHR